MTRPNDPAFPRQSPDKAGLTKREWFAGLAMAAILWRDDKLPLDVAADLACRATEVLIAELAKEKE